jgi:hypothetical protein
MTIPDRIAPLEKALGPSKSCRICARPIPLAAVKCADCFSYQDWRSGLGVSTTVLSMLVALVSVVAAATPGFIGLLAKKDSKMVFGEPALRRGQFMQFASNAGTRPGIVDAARITWRERKSSAPGWIYLLDTQSPDDAPATLKPGESTLLRFTLDMSGEGEVELPRPGAGSECAMLTLWTSFRGEQNSTTRPLNCEDMYVAVHVADLRDRAKTSKTVVDGSSNGAR